MPSGRKCKICSLVKTEDIDYINKHVQKGDLSYQDLSNFLNSNYSAHSPWYPGGIGTHAKHIDKLESPELIQQAAEKGEIIPDNVFTQREKIGSAESYEKLISEYWLNYIKIREQPKNDMAKRNYLDSMAKLLEQLSKEKVMEKDYLTQMNTLKEKREQDTPEQRLDLIEGWFIPALLEKTKDNDEARHYINKLMEFIYNIDSWLGEGKDRSLIAKEGINWLYEKQKA